AAVQRLEHGELARALLEDARDAEEVLGPFRWGQRRPAVLERVPRGLDCEGHVFGAGLGDLGERLLGRGVDRGERLPGARLGPLAADEATVQLAGRDAVARLWLETGSPGH